MQSASMDTETAAAQPDNLLAGCLPVRGLFINYQDYGRPHFLSRPTPTSAGNDTCLIDGRFDFIQREGRRSWYEVLDHCNGLVLFMEDDTDVLHVCNPATRWSARLPPHPGGACYYSSWGWGRRAFLLFDPLVSTEYKVLLTPTGPERKQIENDDACRRMEWPPSTWETWHEFSSSSGMWEEKVFVREGEGAGTAGDLLLNESGFHHVEPSCRYAAYWKGALYVHWHGEFVTRLSMQEKYYYKVIKSPVQLAELKKGVRSFLGRSEKGVYIAAMASQALAKLRVWTLSEFSGNIIEWVPKDQTNLKINTSSWLLENNAFEELKYWKLDLKPKYWEFDLNDGRKNQDTSLVHQNVCWNSDDDNIVDVSDDEEDALPYVKFLGFHPYKEVIFLSSDGYAVAFHLNSPKVQYLGEVHLAGEYHRGIRESFVYTPCLNVHQQQ